MRRASNKTFSKGRLSLKLVAELQVLRRTVYRISSKLEDARFHCHRRCAHRAARTETELGSKQSSSVSPTELYCKEKGFILHVHSALLTASGKKQLLNLHMQQFLQIKAEALKGRIT